MRSSDSLFPIDRRFSCPWRSIYHSLRGGGGSPRFLGRPLARVPRFLTPSGARASRPLQRDPRYCLRATRRSRHRRYGHFEANSRGPRTRASTYRRTRHRDRRKTHYQPAGLQLWSDGIRTHWTTHEISRSDSRHSFPSRPALPGHSRYSPLIWPQDLDSTETVPQPWSALFMHSQLPFTTTNTESQPSIHSASETTCTQAF